jgi:hypothetical protein
VEKLAPVTARLLQQLLAVLKQKESLEVSLGEVVLALALGFLALWVLLAAGALAQAVLDFRSLAPDLDLAQQEYLVELESQVEVLAPGSLERKVR